MALDQLDGLISNREGERLAELARLVPPDEAIVELGSYKGKSTAYLASSGHHVYAIDRWTLGGQRITGMDYDAPETLADFHRQLDMVGVASHVSPIEGDTVAVAKSWKQPVGLLFIDADHSHASVSADLRAWEPHCVGVIAFDDYAERWPGVVQVADDLIARRGRYSERIDNLMTVWLS